MPLTTQVTSANQEIMISIEGRFDFNLHQEFLAAYEQGSGPDFTYVIDLHRAEYLDSSALGMLLILRDHAGGDEAKIKIVRCSPDVKNILAIANFHQLFTIQ